MVRPAWFAWAVCVVVGCGGSTSSELFGGGDASTGGDGSSSGGDGGSTSDAGGGGDSGASACFDSKGTLLKAMKTCATPADCSIVQHTNSCCGDILYAGVSKGKAAQFALCEEAWDKSLPACGCAAGPPRAEDGSEVKSAQDVIVECTNVSNGLGTCVTSKK